MLSKELKKYQHLFAEPKNFPRKQDNATKKINSKSVYGSDTMSKLDSPPVPLYFYSVKYTRDTYIMPQL